MYWEFDVSLISKLIIPLRVWLSDILFIVKKKNGSIYTEAKKWRAAISNIAGLSNRTIIYITSTTWTSSHTKIGAHDRSIILHPDWPELRSAAKCELRSAAIRCNIGAASFLVNWKS